MKRASKVMLTIILGGVVVVLGIVAFVELRPIRILLRNQRLLSAAKTNDLAEARSFLDAYPEAVDAVESHGLRALHWAAFRGHKDMAQLLLDRGADINGQGKQGSPLFLAIGGEQEEMVQFLLDRGADMEVKSRDGRTPLDFAIRDGCKDVAELLIAKGADVNHKDWMGRSLLHLAAASGQKEVAAYLIAKGVEVNAKDNDGKTALSIAVEKGHTEFAVLLRRHGARE